MTPASTIISVFLSSIGSVVSLIFILKLIFERKERKIRKMESYIRNEALKGNKVALAFVLDDKSVNDYRIPIIEEALKGNENAIRILRLKIEEKK